MNRVWNVPSATVRNTYYQVRRIRTDAQRRWWITLSCNCPTETINRRQVCWHKAAVVIRYRQRVRDGEASPDGASGPPA